MQYTVRNISERLDRILRERAQREGKSLNEATLEALEAGLSLSDEPLDQHDLDWMAGTWIEDAEFEKVIASQRQIDEGMWQ